MTDYKLMPVEPSADMLGNAMSVCIGFSGDYGTYNCYLSEDAAREVYQAFRAVAPAVQSGNDERVENWRLDAEDLDALHRNLDDAGVPRCAESGETYSAWGRVLRLSSQPDQPRAGVEALVEAITMARETIASALRANAPDYFKTDADIARHVVIQRIDSALAAHRRQGGK